MALGSHFMSNLSFWLIEAENSLIFHKDQQLIDSGNGEELWFKDIGFTEKLWIFGKHKYLF